MGGSFPEVAGEKNRGRKRKIFSKAVFLTLVASLGMALVFLLLGKFAVLILYGRACLPAAPLLEWMGIAMIAISLIQLGISYWLARRRD